MRKRVINIEICEVVVEIGTVCVKDMCEPDISCAKLCVPRYVCVCVQSMCQSRTMCISNVIRMCR